MTLNQRLSAFIESGTALQSLPPAQAEVLAAQVAYENPWFTPANLGAALQGIRRMLQAEQLIELASRYNLQAPEVPKTIGVAAAGNFPFACFHDCLCVLLSGHNLLIKLSSSDSVLPKYVLGLLCETEPGFRERITFAERLNAADAYIATGSNNTARYFEYYFGSKPNIIRRNRNSAALLTGQETEAELQGLAHDMFRYFGRGCRSVSKIYVPRGYDFFALIQILAGYPGLSEHNKYLNNYDYNKALFLLDLVPFTDTGTLLIRESEALASAPAVLHYAYYQNPEALRLELEALRPHLQCVTASGTELWPEALPLGTAQSPDVWDYADGTDTLQFLTEGLHSAPIVAP